MKAITISQPYASMIARGEKWVENRNWETDYRGPLAIHAGKGTQYLTAKELREYPTSCILATCELIACVDVCNPSAKSHEELNQHGMTVDQVLEHSHCEGPFAWVLFEVRKAAEPIAIAGKQGLWNYYPKDVDSLAY